MDPLLWPLAGLRLHTDELELRPPADADLPTLADLFPSDVAVDPTLRLPVGERGIPTRQAVLRHVWRSRAELAPDCWRICFGAYAGGALVGQQDLKAVDFPLRRIVESSSWVATEYRGRGLAKAMRAMVLQLAFGGLGAIAAESESAEGNDAALGVTRSLGYIPTGDTYVVHDGNVEHMLWSRLSRERWELLRQGYGVGPVSITGLAPCLGLFGIDPPVNVSQRGGGPTVSARSELASPAAVNKRLAP